MPRGQWACKCTGKRRKGKVWGWSPNSVSAQNMWNVINICFKKWLIISGNALKSHGVVASNTLSLSFCLVACDGIFLLFLVLLSRLCTREWLGCLNHENVGIYWAFDSSCFLADSCHLNHQVFPNTLPQLLGTVNKSVCSWLHISSPSPPPRLHLLLLCQKNQGRQLSFSYWEAASFPDFYIIAAVR